MKKKILAMLMAMCLVAACVAMSASAVEEESISVCSEEAGCGQVVQFIDPSFRTGTKCTVSGCGADVWKDVYACKNPSCSMYMVECGGYTYCKPNYHILSSWGKYGVAC